MSFLLLYAKFERNEKKITFFISNKKKYFLDKYVIIKTMPSERMISS